MPRNDWEETMNALILQASTALSKAGLSLGVEGCSVIENLMEAKQAVDLAIDCYCEGEDDAA